MVADDVLAVLLRHAFVFVELSPNKSLKRSIFVKPALCMAARSVSSRSGGVATITRGPRAPRAAPGAPGAPALACAAGGGPGGVAGVA